MLKVHILDRCPYCDGKAYLPVGETTNAKGETYTRYTPCQMCEGTGERGKWVNLTDFLEMLKQTQCRHEHTSYRGGMHFSGGDVWDDIQEVCDDCGVNLDRLTQADYIKMKTKPINST
jgi:hypothetical protein